MACAEGKQPPPNTEISLSCVITGWPTNQDWADAVPMVNVEIRSVESAFMGPEICSEGTSPVMGLAAYLHGILPSYGITEYLLIGGQ